MHREVGWTKDYEHPCNSCVYTEVAQLLSEVLCVMLRASIVHWVYKLDCGLDAVDKR